MSHFVFFFFFFFYPDTGYIEVNQTCPHRANIPEGDSGQQPSKYKIGNGDKHCEENCEWFTVYTLLVKNVEEGLSNKGTFEQKPEGSDGMGKTGVGEECLG